MDEWRDERSLSGARQVGKSTKVSQHAAAGLSEAFFRFSD